MLDDLARLIQERRVVLFAGAGLSQPLGLPSWAALMNRMAEDLGYDPDVLIGPEADYLQIAEFYRLEKGSIGSLRAWMEATWNVDDAALVASRVHNQIVDLNFPFIYTTNYDHNIERAFRLRGKEFTKVKSVLDVASASADLPHIVKFHGDLSDDNSLVLTETDYFDRLDFESPLDVKFRADVLGRSVLFVGYSLKDPNIRLLLYKLQRAWSDPRHCDHRPPCYIFLLRPNPVQERVLESRGIHPIVSASDKPDNALADFFDTLLKLGAA